MTTTKHRSAEEDPFLEAELERALAPYRALLPPEMLVVFRETLSDALTTHPVGSRLFDRTRPHDITQTSEMREKAGSEGFETAEQDDKPKRGGAAS